MKYRFWYDELGRPVLSQNSKQYAIAAYLETEDQYKDVLLPTKGTGPIRAYSYTLYDKIGRTVEAGELLSREEPLAYRHESQVQYSSVANGLVPNGARVQVTRMYYDRAAFSSSESGLGQDNLRPRVASVTYQDRAEGGYERATHYSYDIHGNVESLVQHVREGDRDLRKRIDYEYDLISGNVNRVYYQRGESDQFIHRYGYDGDNRLTEVHTSRDGVIWTKEANYEYYAHGPLARTIIGDSLEIQDHAYTLQGWMKALNGQYFSYALGYFAGDYSGIGTNDNLATPVAADKDLYNGNIATMASLNPKLSETVWTRQFEYDQLNRITGSKSAGLAHADAYKTSYSYDANGNILSLHRYNGQGQAFDALAYHYHNQQNGYKHNTNKLRWVDDNPALSANHEEDLEDQDMDNYHYDELGNLSGDAREEIARIEWNARGKISRVIRTAESAKPDLEFLYDATGNRVAKIVKPKAGNATITYYIRDAQGNVLSVYTKTEVGTGINLTEQYIYGSSRVGMVSGAEANNSRTLGLRSYELTDHLGNVRTVISDKPTALGLTEMLAGYDYYPGGMIAKAYNASDYRHTYNGKEYIEWLGWHDYGERMYNPNLIRFPTPDPIIKPHESSYVGFANNSNVFVDPDGADNVIYLVLTKDQNGKTEISKETAEAIKDKANEYYKALGLNTKVVIYDEGANGKFNINYADMNDSYAVIGTNRKNIVSTARSIDSEWIDNKIEAGKKWSDGSGNPERSKINGKGIVIDHADSQRSLNLREKESITAIELSAFSIVHGSGHNAGVMTAQGDHLYSGLMNDGESIIRTLENNPDYTMEQNILNPSDLNNQKSIDGLKKSFEWSPSATDNYNKNKIQAEMPNLITK